MENENENENEIENHSMIAIGMKVTVGATKSWGPLKYQDKEWTGIVKSVHLSHLVIVNLKTNEEVEVPFHPDSWPLVRIDRMYYA